MAASALRRQVLPSEKLAVSVLMPLNRLSEKLAGSVLTPLNRLLAKLAASD